MQKSRKVRNSDLREVEELVSAARYTEAGHRINALLEADADNPTLQQALGQVLCRSGQAQSALNWFDRALHRGESPALWNEIGVAHRALGHADEAKEAFRRALSLRPSYTEAYLNLVYTARVQKNDREIEALLKLDAGRLGKADRIRVNFALAKAFDDLREYDSAYTHLETGNRLKRETIQYDPSQIESLISQIVTVFSQGFWRKRKLAGLFRGLRSVSGPDSKSRASPLFVVGMPRSGTTLIEQILASHEQVHSAGERNEFKDLVVLRLGSEGPTAFPQAATTATSQELRELAQGYLQAVSGSLGERRLVDKTPMNFLFIGLIRLMWPDAKVIYCDRDPVASCFSCFQRLFTGDQPFAYDQVELGHYQKQLARLMDHWQSSLLDTVIRVRYEDVVDNTEQEVRRILRHCQLPWSEQCLQFHRTDRTILTASSTQVRQPIYDTSVAHWTHYQSHLGPLLQELGVPVQPAGHS